MMYRINKAAVLAAGMMLFGSCCVLAQDTEDVTEAAVAESVTEAAETESVTEATAAAGTVITGQEAVYLGVENYGAPETNSENKENFRYRFMIDGEEQILAIDNGTKDKEGNYDYPIQNILKEGYPYLIDTEGDTVISAQPRAWEEPDFTPVIEGVPGKKTLKNFLTTALMPVGTTLYIYGGGWDWQDVGSSVQTETLGVSPDWVRFFEEQDEYFTYKGVDGDEENVDPTASYYPFGAYNEYYYAGLDCSGYVGWAVYNTFETVDGKEGYVMPAARMAKHFGELGWGVWEHELTDRVMKPGDIMSLNGHVWISLGTCEDGSIVIAHSTPSDSRRGQPGGGVQIGAVGENEECEAYVLADRYMAKYYPKWYERYPATLRDPEVYFTYDSEKAGRFSWNTSGNGVGLADPDGIQEMAPAEVLATLYSE